MDAGGAVLTQAWPGQTIAIDVTGNTLRPHAAAAGGQAQLGTVRQQLPLRLFRPPYDRPAGLWQVAIPPNTTGSVQIRVTTLSAAGIRMLSAELPVTVAADAYQGVDACAACHAGIVGGWRATAHAPVPDCEACHGPGLLHCLTGLPSTIYRQTDGVLCANCHYLDAVEAVEITDQLIAHHQEYSQWRYSPHNPGIGCLTCHVTHVDNATGQAPSPVLACTDCHARSRYQDRWHALPVDCIDCHMPRIVTRDSASTIGIYRRGDSRAHIWRIQPYAESYELFASGGTALARDTEGYFMPLTAACGDCHNGSAAAYLPEPYLRQTWPLIHH